MIRRPAAAGRRAALALWALAAVGCAPEADVAVNLVTASCSAPSPVDSVTHYLFRVSGPGMSTRERGAASNEPPALPRIPVGAARVVEVRAFNGEPRASGVLVSVGRTPPFDVTASAPASVSVVLRRMNAPVPLNFAATPTSCTQLSQQRAGHTATALPDGRALIAGGFSMQGATPVAAASAELYDPAQGFVPLPDMPGGGRSFHTATLLTDGRVLLVGGETYPGGVATTVSGALLFDPVAKAWAPVATLTDRTQHGAALDSGGRVLVVGGYVAGGALAQSIEWYDPATGQFQPAAGLILARGEMGVAAVQDGRFIAVVGGTTGASVTNEIRLYGWDAASSKYVLSTTALLNEARRGNSLSLIADSARLIAVGGYATLNNFVGLAPLASTELVGTAPVAATPGPTIAARGDGCAAKLLDHRVLIAGGREVDGAGVPRASAVVDLIVPGLQTSALGMTPLPRARQYQACATLADGTVLITGGLDEQAGVLTTLQDALSFNAVPLDAP